MDAVYTVSGRESAKKRIEMFVLSTFSEKDSIFYEGEMYKRDDFIKELDAVVLDFPKEDNYYLIIGIEEHTDEKTNKKIERLHKKISKEIFKISKRLSSIIKQFRKEAKKIADRRKVDIKTAAFMVSENYTLEKKTIERQIKKRQKEINLLDKKKSNLKEKQKKIKKEIKLIQKNIKELDQKKQEYEQKNKKIPKYLLNNISKKSGLLSKKQEKINELNLEIKEITSRASVLKRKNTLAENRIYVLKASKDFEAFIKEMTDLKNSIKQKYESQINDILAAAEIKENVFNLYLYTSNKNK